GVYKTIEYKKNLQIIKAENNIGWGMCKLNSDLVLEPTFEHIEIMNGDSLLKVQQNGKVGLYDINGDIIFPISYDDIQLHCSASYCLYVCAKGYSITAYTMDRKRTRYDHKLVSLVNPIKQQKTGNKYTYTLPNGRIIRDSPYQIKHKIGYEDKLRLLIINYGKTNYLLDTGFYNIIPEGFAIPDEYCNPLEIEMGLIPVYSDYRSGVIDRSGNWVIPPNAFGYKVLSPNLIVQHRGNSQKDKEGLTLFRIVHNESPANIGEYNYVNNVPKNNFLIVGNYSSPGNNSLKRGVIDTLGKVIITMKHSKIKIFKNHIVGIDWNRQEGLDNTFVYDLNGNLIWSAPYTDVISIKESNLLKCRIGNNYGLVKLSGEEILPPIHPYLKAIPELNIVQYGTELFKTVIIDIDGHIKFKYPEKLQLVPREKTNALLFTHPQKVVLLNSDFTIKKITRGKFLNTFKQLWPGLGRFMADDKVFFMNLETGFVYKE
ncbi:MAG: WG repeat-containing protein, partial [Bacteroidota bacterium]